MHLAPSGINLEARFVARAAAIFMAANSLADESERHPSGLDLAGRREKCTGNFLTGIAALSPKYGSSLPGKVSSYCSQRL